MTANNKLRPISRRIEALSHTNSSILHRLERLLGRTNEHSRGSLYSEVGAVQSRPQVIVEGWMQRTHLLQDGRQQVLGHLLPGDFVNFALHPQVPSLTNVECVTDVVLADASDLRDHIAAVGPDDPLASAILLVLGVDEAITMNCIVRLTRQSAYERLAHLLLDLHYRLSLAGMVDDNSFELPLTQQALGEALGLSVVHLNRVLMQLRRDGSLERAGRTITLLEPERLRRRVDHTFPRSRIPAPFPAGCGAFAGRPAAFATH
ncbi:Crp/Fnr family transcriptional regulator [Acuticoccus sp. I52.16.1]|uniref:Crp/Fnr family transcriptional regulator n=1 Tax=Acuticoccus sp. I52.16.1 TaxID=2928472 RepID=UPI001FD06F81|nr:Crp/Fnr family transcriptional regulator [Acuticoccus sp. I52.16.1]UOM36243.1 Crp/Fnr family transcriptional regulator [Acuticoccus sp. I52.16.1]